MNPIYKPKGAAAEYGDYAVNIYTGCPHRCYYCFAPQVLHKKREAFHSCVEPRKDIVGELRRQAESLNAIFDKEGRNRAAFVHAFAKFVESQPAVTAHIVTEILEQSGLLSLDG